MNLKQKIIGGLLALVALLGGGNALMNLGSVGIANEYHATTTSNQAGMANYRVVNREGTEFSANPTTTPGVLGSVVITAPGAKFCLYDATSTRTNAEWATTTIACFGTSVAAGTYTFDRAVQKGILIEQTTVDTVSSWASSTITYRNLQ